MDNGETARASSADAGDAAVPDGSEGRFVDPRIAKLINAIRDMRLGEAALDVHTVGLQMDGLHQVHIKRLDRTGRDATLFQGNARAEFTDLVSAVVDALPLLHDFLEQHWFVEVYDEVRGANENLNQTLKAVLSTLRRGGIFKT